MRMQQSETKKLQLAQSDCKNNNRHPMHKISISNMFLHLDKLEKQK